MSKQDAFWSAAKKGPRGWSPAPFFILDLLIVAALLILGPFHPGGIHPGRWLTNPFPDVLPSIVPWAGALGGVSISLVGVAGHARSGDWRPERYGYWHLTRSLLGAFFGSVAVLIVSLLLQNVKQVSTTTSGFTTSGKAVLAVIAFVVGFREETFRSLVIRVVDIILGPSGAEPTLPYALVPSTLELDATTVGTPTKGVVHLLNASNVPLALSLSAITVTGDNLTPTLTEDPVTVASGDSAAITLTWTPKTAGDLAGTLGVKVPGTSVTANVTGTATSKTP